MYITPNQQLNNQFNQLNSRLELLENDHVSYEQTVTGEIEIIESQTLSKTDRDKGGFGSTGLD